MAEEQSAGRHKAGAFDIRNVIGMLMAIYGLILLLMGIFADPELDKTDGVNANLWAGILLLVVGVVFIGWSRLRPIRVPEQVEPPETDATRPSPRRKE
jgi:hypothetical protein